VVELVERVGRLDAGTRATLRVEGIYVALVEVDHREAHPGAPQDLLPVPYRAMRRIAAGEAA
jgi:hypothetical protein